MNYQKKFETKCLHDITALGKLNDQLDLTLQQQIEKENLFNKIVKVVDDLFDEYCESNNVDIDDELDFYDEFQMTILMWNIDDAMTTVTRVK
jgi:hypothetical protein